MEVYAHKTFQKAFKKQPKKVQDQFLNVIALFTEDPYHHSFNNHALAGEFSSLRSFNVTGDVRVHFEELQNGVMLINIGTHSQLY